LDSRATLPGANGATADPALIAAEVAAWIDALPLRDLAAGFGAQAPSAGSVLERLDAWDDTSAQLWDYRRATRSRAHARERARDLRFTSEQERLTLAAAHALGLAGETAPAHAEYDHVLILGSYLDACMQRADRAAALIKEAVSARAVHGLASLRPFEEYDHQVAARLRIEPEETEFGAMDVAVRRAFGVTEAAQATAHPRSHTYVTGAGLPVSVLAGRARDATATRANTADTFRDWAAAHARRGERLLLITTTYFVPFQHCDAIRVLGLEMGCRIDTIGVDPATSAEPALRRPLTVADYLMEIRSALRSMRALYVAARAQTS
jgi:hypothetical protein